MFLFNVIESHDTILYKTFNLHIGKESQNKSKYVYFNIWKQCQGLEKIITKLLQCYHPVL
jgi:hypothetical protein